MYINFNSPIPIYLQIANIIEEDIVHGKIKEGEKISSENVLAKKYNVSRLTVRRALEELIRKSYIVKRKGSGSYVKSKQSREVSIFDFAGITEAFNQKNIELKKVLIEKLTIKQILEKENPFYGRAVYFFSRLDIVDKSRIIFEKFYLDKEMFKNLNKFDLENSKISEIVEKEYFLRPTKMKQKFKAILTDDYLRKILGFKNKKTILFTKREIFFDENLGIYSEIYVDTDKFDFCQEIWR